MDEPYVHFQQLCARLVALKGHQGSRASFELVHSFLGVPEADARAAVLAEIAELESTLPA